MLITCPECGGKISSSTSQCIHCGCKISVCPECNEVYKGEVTECKKCGFKFVKTASVAGNARNTKENCTVLYDEWKSSSVVNELIHWSGVIRVFMRLVFLVLIWVAGSKLCDWAIDIASGDLSTVDKALTNTSSVRDDVKILFVFGWLSFFISYVYEYFCFIGRKSIKKWFSDNGVDLVSSIKDYISSSNFSLKTKQSMKREKNIMASLIDSCMLSDILYAEKTQKKLILSCLFLATSCVFLIIFSLSNVESFMQYVFLYGFEDISLSVITKWWALIVGFILSVVADLCYNNRSFTKRRVEFVKNNMADAYANYSNYFKI